MQINDLDYVKNTLEVEDDKVKGAIAIEALTISLSIGSSFAYTRSFSFTWAYAPGISFGGS